MSILYQTPTADGVLMDFSQFVDKIIELANTPGGFIAALVVSLPFALWLIGSYSKRRAEASKIEAEAKRIRAQGDADTDLADTKNTAKILDIMERLTANDTEKNRMIQTEFEKRREENEQNRKTLDKVSEALQEFNTENKAWRFDFKTNSHMIDGSLLSLASKIEGMAGVMDVLAKENDDSHLWMRETITDIHEKIVTIHTQLGVIYKLATRPDKPPPLPHDQTPAEPGKIIHADAGAQVPDIPRAS